jgi:hypothetical protein
MTATINKESAFADLIRNHEHQWVAIDERDGVEFIVGSGKDAVEAAKDAEAKGFPDALLFKVPSFTSTFVFNLDRGPGGSELTRRTSY